MIVLGILIGYFLAILIPNDNPKSVIFFHYLSSIVITIIVWEGNLKLDDWMNKNYPWLDKPGKRIMVHLPSSLVYSALAIFISMLLFDAYVCKIPFANRFSLMLTSIILGLLVTVTIISIEVSAQFFRQWKNSLIEVEKYKTESAQAQLQNLKEQVNPHFLFNNLSVLSSLVYKDQDKAVDFINQLSKVYRYLLDSRNTELISLQEELTFIKSYIYLLEIRFDKNIRFDIQINESAMKLYLPPMALQMLVENTIKHNEVSAELPLTVSIIAQNNLLEVKNNLQARLQQEESSKTGLNNIRERYKHYTDKKVEVLSDNKFFTVKLPLLHQAA